MRVTELKALARDRGLRNYSRMRKAELVALLQNNPPPAPWSRAPSGLPQMSTWDPRGVPGPPLAGRCAPSGPWEPGPIDDRNRGSLLNKKWIYSNNKEMSKSRPQVKSKLNDWYDWLINHVPKTIKDGAKDGKDGKAFKTFKDKIMGFYNRVTGSTANQTQRSAEPEPFKPIELEQAFNRAYK